MHTLCPAPHSIETRPGEAEKGVDEDRIQYPVTEYPRLTSPLLFQTDSSKQQIQGSNNYWAQTTQNPILALQPSSIDNIPNFPAWLSLTSEQNSCEPRGRSANRLTDKNSPEVSDRGRANCWAQFTKAYM